MVNGRNTLSKPIAEEIIEKLSIEQSIDENYMPFGDGDSATKIVMRMEERLK